MVTSPQMNLHKLTILATLIIAVGTTVAASPAELTVFPQESSTRIDSFTSYEITIENLGPVEDTYTFTTNNIQEIDIAPQKVTLKPGEEETVNVWYNPSQDREEGTYSFSITAESRATGDSYSAEIIASVIRDHDVAISVQNSRTVCRGETATYTVEVTNKGLQKEEFQLSTGYGQLSQNKVTLEDGETKTVTLTASSEKAATKNFNVRAASTTSYAQAIESVRFISETCYASETSVTPTEKKMPGGKTAVFEVVIQNKGTKQDEFTLSATTGKFSENPVTVDAKSTETVELKVERQKLGKKTIKITAEGESKSSATATLQTYNGNNMKLSFRQGQVSVCETQDEAKIHTVIENTGETDETFKLETNRGTLQSETVNVEAGKKETVTTQLDATQMKTGTYKVKTTATAATYGKPVKSTTTTLQVENCWDISMNVVPEVASAGENRSVIYEINLENTGTKENTYELAYKGPEWVSIKPKEVTVAPGKTGKAYMYAGIPFKKEGNVQITATAVGTNTTASQTVELVIGQKIKEAIKSNAGNGITGSFSNALKNFKATGTLTQAAIAALVALLITAIILAREW